MGLIDKILDTELEEKFFRRTVFIGIVLILFCVLIVFLNLGMMRPYTMPSEATKKNDNKIEFGVDNIQISRKYLEITGFAYKKGQHVEAFDNRFVIRNEKTKKMKALPTEMVKRQELALIDNNKLDCSNGGMYSKALIIGLPKGLYQLYIEYKSDNENIIFDTGIVFNYGS